MNLPFSHCMAFLLFACLTWRFFDIPEAATDRVVKALADNYHGLQCPLNFTHYSVHDHEYSYNLQVQTGNNGRQVLRRCERERHSTESLWRWPDSTEVNQSDAHLIEHVCNDMQYQLWEGKHELPNQRCLDDPGHVECGLDVVEEEKDEDVINGATTATSALPYLLNGMYPGTLWCGAGNIARDIYTNLGEHKHEDACCREHDLCKPAIEAMNSRYGESNPSVFTVSHCSCDVALYNCFRRLDTPVAREIGRVFFNLVKMKCFDFELKDVCLNSFFGWCTHHERRCGAVLKSNPPFPLY